MLQAEEGYKRQVDERSDCGVREPSVRSTVGRGHHATIRRGSARKMTKLTQNAHMVATPAHA